MDGFVNQTRTGCGSCGATRETIPGDLYYDDEERDVVETCFACRVRDARAVEARRELISAITRFFSHDGGTLSTLLTSAVAKGHGRDDVIAAYNEVRKAFKFETRGEAQFVISERQPSLQLGTKILAAEKPDASALTVAVLPPVFEQTKGGRGDKLVRFYSAFSPPRWIVDQHPTRGSMIGFVRAEIPKTCTGFVVIGFAKNGRSCFLAPLGPEQLDAHAFYEALRDLPKKREQRRAQTEQIRLRYGLPLEPEKPYVCAGCNKASKSRGVGKCAVCRQDCLG